MLQLLDRLQHEVRHGAPWTEVTADRPTRAAGVVITCDCGKRWLSRAPWDRQAGF